MENHDKCDAYINSNHQQKDISLLQHMQGCGYTLILIFFVDMIIRYITLSAYRTNSKARWFMLHAIINFFVAAFSIKDSIIVSGDFSCIYDLFCKLSSRRRQTT